MAKYPEWSDVEWDFPLNIEFETKTLISSFDGMGREKRRRKLLYPKRNITVNYSNRFLTRAQVRTLWQFYLDRGGPYEAFSFFVSGPDATVAQSGLNTYEGEYIGVGDGFTTDFDLPGRSIQNETLYVDGVAWNPVTDYNISGEAGADGCDKVGLNQAPSAGAVLTIDFEGVLRVRCRFEGDVFGYQDFYNIVGRTGVRLIGLLNDE